VDGVEGLFEGDGAGMILGDGVGWNVGEAVASGVSATGMPLTCNS
jgi:hypothetical protein